MADFWVDKKRLFLQTRNDEELAGLYDQTVDTGERLLINGTWYSNHDFAEEIDRRMRKALG